jgi:hypothetical protein
MINTVPCPSCNRELRVPDQLLGKLVKCPACSTTFAANLSPPSPPGGADVNQEMEQPDRQSEPLEDIPDSSRGGDADEYCEPRPRRSRRRNRAREAVAAPAIALIVLGSVYIFVNFIVLTLRFLNFSNAINGPPPGASPATALGFKIGIYGGFCIELLGFFLGGAIILGAIQMKGLRNFAFAMTCCIIAMLPCHYCCLLGIPFGIWGLIILNSEEVKSAFR